MSKYCHVLLTNNCFSLTNIFIVTFFRRDMVWRACHSGVLETSSHQCITHWSSSPSSPSPSSASSSASTETHYFVTRVEARDTFACYSYTVLEQAVVVEMLGTECHSNNNNSSFQQQLYLQSYSLLCFCWWFMLHYFNGPHTTDGDIYHLLAQRVMKLCVQLQHTHFKTDTNII